MKFREWLEETHSTRFELVRHFLPRFFDSDLVGSSGDWLRVAGGAAALLASSWMLLAFLLLFKYGHLPFARRVFEMRADLASLTAMCVCVTVLLAALLWQSLFPSLRDFLALAGMPVSASDVFTGKLCALLGVFSAFLSLLTVPTSVVYAAMTGGPLGKGLLMMSAASTITFFGLAALQGISLNLLPARWFERFMIWTQAALAALAIAAFSLAAWKGPSLVWILDLSAYRILLAALLAPSVAALAYLTSFHRFQRVILDAPTVRTNRRTDWLMRALELAFRSPQEQAAFTFLWITIKRNRVHRLAVLVYAGLAGAWMARSIIFLASQKAAPSEWDRVMYAAWPLGLAVFTTLGLRHLFSLPADLKSNWVFRVADREGRLAWLNAIERCVLAVATAPLVLGALFTLRLEPPLAAAAWVCLAAALVAIGFEILFRQWRKMPFTCTYLPGKRTPLQNAILFFSAMLALTPIAWIVHGCASNPASFLILFTLEMLVWLRLRQARMKNWGQVALIYEEQLAGEVDAFGLAEDGGNFAQEQFHRQWSEYLRSDGDTPIVSALSADESHLDRLRAWLRAIPQDVRFAARMLTKSPGFALTVILTLGLGLGLNAAFFAIFNAFLLEPLAVRDPASLVSIEFSTRGGREAAHLSWRDYAMFSKAVDPVVEVSASTVEGTGLEGNAAKVGMVSSNYFSMLGVGASAGRLFQPGDDRTVIVLAHRTWQHRFGGDPNIIGRKLQVDGTPFEVVGVAAPEFPGVAVGTQAVAPPELARYGVGAADFWIPAEAGIRLPLGSTLPVLGVVGRLKPGYTAERVRPELTSLTRAMTRDHAQYDQISYATLESLDIPITWTALRYSLPLLFAFVLTMLIPCANVGNIMLARAITRQRELGVRLSLGAGRGRLVRQLLTESLVLSLLASLAGVVLARVALAGFLKLIYATAPATLLYRARIPDFPIGRHVLFYMLLVSLVTTALFALAPAAQATRRAVAYALRGEFGDGLRSSNLRDVLVVGQVAACAMLLVVAAVMLRGTMRAKSMSRGYDLAGIYGIANESPADARALAGMLRDEPWVASMSYFGRAFQEMDSASVSGHPAYIHFSSGGFFQLVRIPIVRGRAFTDVEAEHQAPVAVISEMAARQMWPAGDDPIGKTITIERGSNQNARLPGFEHAIVIGVSGDIVARVRDGGPRPSIHFPDSVRRDSQLLAVRGTGSAEDTRRRLEAALAKAPGATHGARVVEAREIEQWELYPQQAVSWLSELLGAVALLLTVSGIYGVMAFMASQRTKEIGIRMALGATASDVARFMLAGSTRLAAIGLMFGAVLAIGALQWAASEVEFAMNPYDIPAYALSFFAVAAAGLIAGLGPTRRACRVDPQSALRAD